MQINSLLAWTQNWQEKFYLTLILLNRQTTQDFLRNYKKTLGSLEFGLLAGKFVCWHFETIPMRKKLW
jgi:hypothetical protein